MENKTLKVDEIYVPVKRRKTLNMKVVNEIAESMLDEGQLTPILVRRDRERFVLVEGLHRLEACKALGEETIEGFIVQARLH
jgi:ParB-like chromosome segregation protein Spo0J